MRRKSIGARGYLQFGLESSNDLKGDSAFNLGATYTQTAINPLNGEWRTGAQTGKEPGVFTEIHQPLDPLTRYFVAGKLGYQTRIVNMFDDAGMKRAEVRLPAAQLELGAGRELGSWGEARVGYRWGSGTGEVITGTPAPDFDVAQGEVFGRLSVDTFDSLYFPRSGHLAGLEWHAARDRLGANVDYDQVLLGILTPIPGVPIPSSARSPARPRWTTMHRSKASFSWAVSSVSPVSTRMS